MVDVLSNGFTSTLYKNIHEMKRFNWSFEELINLPPLELSIFKNMIVKDIKDKK